MNQDLLNALATVSGWNAPQNLAGLGKLGVSAVRNPSILKSLQGLPGGAIGYTDPNLDTPAAATGSIVSMAPSVGTDPDVLKHELRHVQQSNVLGPAYLPAAVGEAIGTDYGSGALERDAIAHTTPNAEMLRPGSSMNKGEQNPILQALLGKILGK